MLSRYMTLPSLYWLGTTIHATLTSTALSSSPGQHHAVRDKEFTSLPLAGFSEDRSERLLGSCYSPRPGWASLGAHLSSSTRSLWFSLVATALVLCSRCRASRSVLSTFSSSSSSAFCFCKSPCLVEEQSLEARPGFTFHKQLTPQEMGTDPLRKMVTPLRPSLCGVRHQTAGDEGCQSGLSVSSSILWSLGFPVTVCPFYRSPESIRLHSTPF